MTGKKTMQVLCLLLCSSCAYIQIAIHNTSIHFQNNSSISNYEATQIINYSMGVTGESFLLMGWTIVFSDGWMKYKDEKSGEVWVADGLTDTGRNIIFISIHECMWDNALVHEIHHLIRLKNGMKGDPKHKDKAFWNNVKIMSARGMERCPEEYKRTPPKHNEIN